MKYETKLKMKRFKYKETLGKKKIVVEAKKIISGWGLKMPEKVKFAFDFGLKDFYRIGELEFWIANEMNEGYCGKFLFLFSAQTCPQHYHIKKHETFYIVKGVVLMKADSLKFKMIEGNCFTMKPGVKHTFTAVKGPALILEVSKPCEPGDSIFQNKKIMDTLK